MADITKCDGNECETREGCYRYTAESSYMQSKFAEPPYVLSSDEEECPYFWDNTKGFAALPDKS